MNERPTPSDPAKLFAGLDLRKAPPVERWNPPFCGDLDIRVARDGTWYYLGSPIGRLPLVKLFASVLKREDGRHYLVTPVEKVGIKVDDAPFVAVEVRATGTGRDAELAFRTNVDDVVTAGPDHAIRVEIDPETQEPAPYIHIRRGLEALIGRAVFYELVGLAEERDGVLGVWSGGTFFPLGRPHG